MDTLGLLGQALECSICLEQLDISSRVLPCQHTFCTSCLLDIISSHKELRCPECRALVTVPFDSLKPNIILMRILEGMKNIPQETFIKKPKVSSSLEPQEDLMKQTVASSLCPNSPTINCVSNTMPLLTKPTAQLPNATAHSPYTYLQFLGSDCSNISPSASDIFSSNSSQEISVASVISSSASTNPFFNSSAQSSKPSEPPCLFPSTFYKSPDSSLCDLSPSINLFHNIASNSEQVSGNFNIEESQSEVRNHNCLNSSSNTKPFFTPFSSLQTSANDNLGHFQNVSPCVSLPSHSNVSHLGLESSINFQALVSPLNIQARALFNYEKREERDLSFKKGDTIQISKQIDENWLYGELNNNFGFIPSSYVTLLEPLPSHVPQCKALYDFKINVQEERNCLTFNKGDTITVLRRIDDNWSEGKLNTHIGIFPLSFVQLNDSAKALLKGSTRSLEVTNATENSKNLTKSNQNSALDCSSQLPNTESSEKSTSLKLYVALYSYRPRKADELELRKGYLYSVSDKCLDGWCKGRCLSTDKIGVFPGNYVQPAKAQTISAFLSRRTSKVLPSSPVHNFGSNSTSSSLNRNSSVKSTTIISNSRPLSSIASSFSADLSHTTSSPTVPPELPPRLGTMISSNICDQVNDARSEKGSTATSSPCPSPISHNEMLKGTKERGSFNRGIPMMKKSTNSKWENSTQLVSIDNASFADPMKSSDTLKESHLKKNINVTPESNGSPKSSNHLVPLFIERYRCIEGYPPNGENELELKIGDLVYVHKKGEDGWYKGTLKRTGKTGLFPASFVQPF